MTRPTLSERARYRIAPSPLVADRFRRWLGRRSAPQQAAFWAGVYLMDGQISVDTLIHGVELSIPAELEAIKPPARQSKRPQAFAITTMSEKSQSKLSGSAFHPILIVKISCWLSRRKRAPVVFSRAHLETDESGIRARASLTLPE